MLKKDQVLSNNELMAIFKCSNTGGMRRSKKTNSLVIVCNHIKSFYQDKWKNGILHYTGMGLKGDQSLSFMQNKTLAESKTNGVEIHLFEVFETSKYTYKGEVSLSAEPYQDRQTDIDNQDRNVWIFPLKLKA
ncbi:HNH endonuclease [[Pasteurella] aerogenes]|nr:HNH endonuclease [[Pasteurella] aerogenes]